MNDNNASTETAGGLQRSLGLVACIAIVVGNVIGTGVFLKARAITCNVGSPSLALVVWVAAGLLSLAGILTYAELSAMMPKAGGEYVYIGAAYGRRWGFVSGWTSYAVSYAASQAAKASAFAIFLNVMSGGTLDRALLTLTIGPKTISLGILQAVALAILLAVMIVNLAAVAVTGRVAVVLTILKVGLVSALGIATFVFARGDWMNFAMTAQGGACEGITSARGGMSGFAAAMLAALWAFDGWVNLPVLAGEVRNPKRNLPLGLFAGMAIVTTLYLLCNVAYLYALTPTQIANIPASSSVASEAIRSFTGPVAARVIAAIMLISTLGSLHSGVLAGARIPYAMSADGVFFPALGRLSKARVPFLAIISLVVWAGILSLSGSYDALTDYAMFSSWVFYGMATASVFVLRRRLPDAERPYRAWGYPVVPALFLLVTAWLILNTLWTRPLQSAIGIVLVLAGLPFYRRK